MKNILSSATKIVFIMISFTVCVGFFMGMVDGKDFLILASMVFAFYYGTKGATPIEPGTPVKEL